MTERKSFPLRISKDLYEQLRRWAESEMRSVNAQIEYLLRDAVRRRAGPSDAQDNGRPTDPMPNSNEER